MSFNSILSAMLLMVASASVTGFSAVPEPELVKNINTQSGANHSSPEYLCSSNGFVCFSASDGLSGKELWRSDGTEEGTYRVKDIMPGDVGSNPSGLIEYNGIIYFSASSPNDGRELWRTDGTAEGTYQLVDLNPVVNGSSSPSNFFEYDGLLYFKTNNSLCYTDGTAEGTVKFVNTLVFSATISSPVVMGNTLYFTRKHYEELLGILVEDYNLYQTELDGEEFQVSPVGTQDDVRDLVVRPPAPDSPALPEESVLFFLGKPKIDGADGLYLLSNAGEPTLLRSAFAPIGNETTLSNLRLWGDKVVFTVTKTNSNRTSIWCSDGTSSGTRALFEDDVQRSVLETVGNKCYFLQHNPQTPALFDLGYIDFEGQEVVIISESIFPQGTRSFQTLGDLLLISQPHVSGRDRLWRTQGTSDTTWEIPGPGMQGTDPLKDRVTLLGDRLFLPLVDSTSGAELYVLDVSPQLMVETYVSGDSPQLLEDGAEVGEIVASSDGQAEPLKLRLSLTGYEALTDLEISSSAVSGWLVTVPAVIQPGVPVLAEVSFTGEEESSLETTVEISSVSGGISHTLHFSARVLAEDVAPEIWCMPTSRLLLSGEPLTLSPAVATGAQPATFAWHRGETLVGEDLELSLPSVTLGDAGAYILTVTTPSGNISSSPIEIGVVQPAPASVQLLVGKDLVQTCNAKASPGATLTYLWSYNGEPINDPAGFYGAQKATLKFSKALLERVGVYECVVTLTAGDDELSLSHGLTNVFALSRPVVAPLDSLQHFIGQEVQFQVLADQPDCTFMIKGLPPGLKMSKSGLITGRVTKSLPNNEAYQVTVSARNAAGVGEPVVFGWTVRPFLSAGNYEGLIGRNELLDGGLAQGSLVKMTASSTGTVSGQLFHAGKTWRFAKLPTFDPLGTRSERQVQISIPQGKGAEPLRLMLEVTDDSAATSSCLMTLSDGSDNESNGDLNFYPAKPNYPWNESKIPVFWTLISGEVDSSGVPRGAGFITASVSKNSSMLSWKGSLADGTTITGSSGLCQDHQDPDVWGISLHRVLYKGSGSVHGPLKLFAPLDTNVEWNKDEPSAPSRDRVYGSGFPLRNVAARFNQCDIGKEDLLMQIPEGEQNALVSIVGSDVPGLEMSQTFTLTSKQKADLPGLDAEHFIKSLTFNYKTCTFKGTLVIPNEEDSKLTRTVPFQGTILQNDGVSLGYFLLPELPAPGQPASSLKKTPVQSCLIQIEATEN